MGSKVKGKKGKLKWKGDGPIPIEPRPGDKLHKVKPPKPTQVQPERDPSQPSVGVGIAPMVTYTCQLETCGIDFERPRRGGRAPKYCSDEHRNLANYNRAKANGTTSTPRVAGAEKQLLQLLLAGAKFKYSADEQVFMIPKGFSAEIPDNLVSTLVAAIQRSKENNDGEV